MKPLITNYSTFLLALELELIPEPVPGAGIGEQVTVPVPAQGVTGVKKREPEGSLFF